MIYMIFEGFTVFQNFTFQMSNDYSERPSKRQKFQAVPFWNNPSGNPKRQLVSDKKLGITTSCRPRMYVRLTS